MHCIRHQRLLCLDIITHQSNRRRRDSTHSLMSIGHLISVFFVLLSSLSAPVVAFRLPPLSPTTRGVITTALTRPNTLLMMSDNKWTDPDDLETSRRALLVSAFVPFFASWKIDEMSKNDRTFQIERDEKNRQADQIFQLQLKDKLNARQSKLLAKLMKEQIDHKYSGINGEARVQAYKSEKEFLGT